MTLVNIQAVRESAAYRPGGYVEDVLSSGVVEGDFVSIHDATYDALVLKYAGYKRPCGPGCQLKRLLAKLGLTAAPGCKCEERAATMDVWGEDECVRRMDEIVGWLKEEADRRGVPFIETAARLMVKRAIYLARHHLDT